MKKKLIPIVGCDFISPKGRTFCFQLCQHTEEGFRAVMVADFHGETWQRVNFTKANEKRKAAFLRLARIYMERSIPAVYGMKPVPLN
jgi:hypothetical protein